ncbi:MAG: hypothetical protein ACI4PL_01185, partial [Faecousia sp.]
KLLFTLLVSNFLSLRTSPLKWCGNPPVKWGNGTKTALKPWGIATPVCALARNDSMFCYAKQQFICLLAENMDDAFLMQVCYNVQPEREGLRHGKNSGGGRREAHRGAAAPEPYPGGV